MSQVEGWSQQRTPALGFGLRETQGSLRGVAKQQPEPMKLSITKTCLCIVWSVAADLAAGFVELASGKAREVCESDDEGCGGSDKVLVADGATGTTVHGHELPRDFSEVVRNYTSLGQDMATQHVVHLPHAREGRCDRVPVECHGPKTGSCRLTGGRQVAKFWARGRIPPLSKWIRQRLPGLRVRAEDPDVRYRCPRLGLHATCSREGHDSALRHGPQFLHYALSQTSHGGSIRVFPEGVYCAVQRVGRRWSRDVLG
mmetsp:Transcript_28972/g.84573  ORF Transcript_28972/g.84573 Transcript_28972/m.84573 type:complete len:257 (+) Transcript_28972:70-840(+)